MCGGGAGQGRVGPQLEAVPRIKPGAGRGTGQLPSGIQAQSKRLRPRPSLSSLLFLLARFPFLR